MVSFFQFGNETGILKISSFSPDDAGEFRRAVEVALLHATDAGLTNLMLDLRDNGGGSICLGYALSQYVRLSEVYFAMTGGGCVRACARVCFFF